MGTSRKRILNVIPVIDRRNGGGVAERGILLSKNLHLRGFMVSTLSLNTDIENSVFEDLNGTQVTLLPILNLRFGIPFPSLFTIYKLIRDADVIHFNNHWSVLNALVYFVNVFFRRSMIVCPAGSLVDTGRTGLIKRMYDAVVGRRIIRAAAAVAVTHREVIDFQKYGIQPDAISVIPNGIEVHGRAEIQAKKFDRPYILFLGRLNKIKGVDLLVDAFLEVIMDSSIGYDLVIAGQDEGELNSLRSNIVKAGATDRVHFPGFLFDDVKEAYLRGSSALVIPSRSEAMSIVVLEAGLYSVPVICTDQCGLEYFHSKGVITVTTPTVDGIKSELISFARNGPRREQASALSRVVRNEFSWEQVALKYEKVIRDCL